MKYLHYYGFDIECLQWKIDFSVIGKQCDSLYNIYVNYSNNGFVITFGLFYDLTDVNFKVFPD